MQWLNSQHNMISLFGNRHYLRKLPTSRTLSSRLVKPWISVLLMTSPLEVPLRKLKQKGSFCLQVCLLYAVVFWFDKNNYLYGDIVHFISVENFNSICKNWLSTIYSGQHQTACLDEVQKLKMGSSEVSELAGGDASYTAPSCVASLSLSGIAKVYLK